ncbi:discoidin domain-containing protein [Actinopolyspora sp. H202]|uniref:discoidin domain-containing protein n=1 Tax=Actinopolyspora sp. H202 TaxID=1500456 RepID=UPI003EE748A0
MHDSATVASRQRPLGRGHTAALAAGMLVLGCAAQFTTGTPVAEAEQLSRQAAPSVVEVTGSQGDWRLMVDGSPYQVKGLTWGPAPDQAASRMPELKRMGVNTVRTWGTDATTAPLLDAAAANGIKVMNGFWLQPGGGPGSGGCIDYVSDSEYKSTMLSDITGWVDTYKSHPGVLMWNVGNESILGLRDCFSGQELEQQRDAYASFVNRVTERIHAIDPNHPVTSTDAWTGAWPYLKENAPALDLYSVNAYSDVCGVSQDWNSGGYSKPYIVTETGPPGEWEVSDDVNGVPDEPTDVAKAQGYTEAWNCVTGHEGVALGATLFHYGTENDFGGVWFNLVPGGEKRLSYYSVADAYGGRVGGNTPPVISNMSVDTPTSVPAGETFTLSADVSDPDGDPIDYRIMINSKYMDSSSALVPAPGFTGSGPFTVTVPERLGVWKVYLYARDGQGNVGIETQSFRVVPPEASGTNVALDKPASASSYQKTGSGAPFPPANVTDGDDSTRWASDWSDPQWIQVDLGSATSFDHLQLVWEAAYGSHYEIRVSEDGTNWNTIHTMSNGNGGVDSLDVSGTGRYVRMYGTERGTGYGYSLKEFGIYRN